MENKVKIVFGIFLVLIFSGCSCENEHEDLQDTSEVLEGQVGRIITQKDALVFEAPCLFAEQDEKKLYYSVNDRLIRFYSVIDLHGDTIALDKSIDTESFRFVGGLSSEKTKIRNPYFFNGRMNCYYLDKNYFYAYLDEPFPEFIILGRAKDMKLLGGNYVCIQDKIYSKGVALSGVDVSSFHTMEVFQEGSEWKRTIGLDNYSMYYNNEVLDESYFNRLIAPNDSLRKIYFKH